MAIVVDPGEHHDLWLALLREQLPDDEFVHPDDDVDPVTVESVISWKHPTERILGYPNLRALLLASAGFDHLDPAVMAAVPVVRLIDPAMADDIALYCLSWVIHFQRDFDRFASDQPTATWSRPAPRFPRDYTVGVLGHGAIGSVVLETCAQHGFRTVGWSRSNHDRSYDEFFEASDVVVNLLPLDESTHQAIAAEELAALGDGVVINVGRGGTVDTGALLAALDGRMRAAVLDVFTTEPLPADDPLWAHPKVTITPHIAGRTDPTTSVPVIVESIVDLRAGRRPAGLVER